MINVTKTFFPPIADYQKQIQRIWDNQWLTNRGSLVLELEEKLSEYLALQQSKMIIMNNGTIPLQIALKLLGKGAFASVYQVKRKKDGNIYAMKRVKFGAMSSKEKDNAVNEIRILASVQHANIIGYKESFYDEESKTLNIIMDYADEGDLDGGLENLAKFIKSLN